MQLNVLFSQLLDGIPLPYLTQKQSFFGLDFYMTPDVLIPRPETELLVSAALDFINKRNPPIIAADVGTGSGCIAVTLSFSHPGLWVIASDISYNAIRIAKRNAHAYNQNKGIDFVVSNLFSGIATKFDIICANLPYIPSKRLAKLHVSKHEPLCALDGGSDGFSLIHRLVHQSASFLKPHGAMFLEIDYTQAKQITCLFTELFPSSSITIEKDHAGQERLAILKL